MSLAVGGSSAGQPPQSAPCALLLSPCCPSRAPPAGEDNTPASIQTFRLLDDAGMALPAAPTVLLDQPALAVSMQKTMVRVAEFDQVTPNIAKQAKHRCRDLQRVTKFDLSAEHET